MSQIPSQLVGKGFKFKILNRASKMPFAASNLPPEQYERFNAAGYINGKTIITTDQIAQAWLDAGYNYGVCGMEHLIIIDADHPELSKRIEAILPPTYAVVTPKKGKHYYYICTGFNTKTVLHHPSEVEEIIVRDKKSVEPIHLGEIQVGTSYVVGPFCLYPETHAVYMPDNNYDIATIPFTMLHDALGEFMGARDNRESVADTNELSCVEIAKYYGATLHAGGDKLVGSHPSHGSTTGHNFEIRPAQNDWICRRHNIPGQKKGSGGGAFKLIAVCEGFILCEDVTPDMLPDDIFHKTLDIAEKKFGYKRRGKKEQPAKEFNQLPSCDYSTYLKDTVNATVKPKRYPLGISVLDENSNGGVMDATMMLIAARTKAGKSTILVDFAYRWAKAGHHVLFLELEMTQKEIYDRFSARHTKLNYWEIENKSPSALKIVSDKMHELESIMSNIDIVAQPIVTLNMEDVKKIVDSREATIGSRFDMIVIDYAGVMDTQNKQQYWERSQNIAREIRAYTLLENRIVCIAAQANNKGDDSAIDVFDKIAGSSEWGKKATWVLFVDRKKEQVQATSKRGEDLGYQVDGKEFIKHAVQVDGVNVPVGTTLKVQLRGRSVVEGTFELPFSHACCAFGDLLADNKHFQGLWGNPNIVGGVK